LIVCLILGVVARLKMPATPIPDADTDGYLFPAFDWLTGSGFVQHDGRDWLYPGFIAGVLKLSASLGVLVRIQQCLGLIAILITSVSFYLHLHWSSRRSPMAMIATALLMLVPLYFISLGTNQLWIESAIRPEAVFTFVFSFLFLGITLSSLAFSSVLNRNFLVLGGLLTLCSSYLLFLLKPAWGLAFPLSFLPYCLFLFVRRFRAPSAQTLLYSLIFVVSLHFFPLILGFKHDRASEDFLPFTLVSIHAKQISTISSSDEETTRFLADLTATLRRATPENDWGILHFDGDFLLYKTPFFEKERQRLGLSPDRFHSLCYSVYFQTLLRRPVLMAEKVGIQLAAFLRNGQRFLCENIGTDKARDLVRLACLNTPLSSPFDQSFVKRIYKDWTQQLNLNRNLELPSLSLIRGISHFVHSISLPLQLTVLFATLCSYVLVWRWVYHSGDSTDEAPANGRPLLSSAFVIATLATLIYGCATTVAISHSFDVERYYITLGIPLSVLTVRSLSFLGELIFFEIRTARSSTNMQNFKASPKKH
jgi:hypothetical protein